MLLLTIAASLQAAMVVGGFAYSKKIETRLFAEPKPLASVSGKTVGYGKKLTITEAQGAWLKVTEADNRGWVFKGNVAEVPPEKIKGIDVIPLDASATSATDANRSLKDSARPLSDSAVSYANRNNMGNAPKDLAWMSTQCAAVTDQVVEEYLKTHHKGEYQ